MKFMTKPFLAILLAFTSFSAVSSAADLKEGTTTATTLRRVGIFKAESATVLNTEDKGNGFTKNQVRITLTVQGNICAGDPNTLSAFIDDQQQLNLFVTKDPQGPLACQMISREVSVNVDLDIMLYHGKGEIIKVRGSVITLSEANGVVAAKIEDVKK